MASAAENGGAVGARVTALERQYTAISSKLDALTEKMDARRAVPWGAIGTGVAMLAFLGGIVIWAFSAYILQIQVAQQSADRRIEQLAMVTVPRAELDDRRIVSNARTDRIEADILRIQEGIVPRGEHSERWRSTDAEIAGVQRQLDQLRADFGGTYSLKDALRDLQQRLERIENKEISQ